MALCQQGYLNGILTHNLNMQMSWLVDHQAGRVKWGQFKQTDPLGVAHGACVSKNEWASLHNSAARAKHKCTHVRLYFVELLVAHWVVIGQYTMGRSLMDRSIL